MDPITIAHVSDVHLGNDYFWRSFYRGRWYQNTEDDALLQGLENALREVGPDYVILSGDIVNKCRTAHFHHAAERLKKLLNGAGIDIKSQVLVIPGNHDVRLFPKEDAVFKRLKEFYYFLQDFFSEKNLLARKTRFVVVDVERKLAFYCLDSTLKEKQPGAEGEVGIRQRDWLREKHEELKKLRPDFETFVKIAVVHHHPHPIEAGGQERFMQLLDAGAVINLFQNLEVNIVLHGHKHFPHQLPHYYEGGRHYTVLGAGTATCPFPEEQSGEGNSFNVLKLYPPANLLEVQRWKANNEKRYVAYFPQPLRYPLFKPSHSGYKMGEFRAIIRIQDMTGACTVTHKRLRLVVDRADFELRNISFGMSSSVPSGEIIDFDYDRAAISDVDWEARNKDRYAGRLVLSQALRQGHEPIDLWSVYSLRGSLCMKRAEYPTFYPGKADPIESADILVVHPCDLLSLVVEFPRGFRVAPRPRIEDQNGMTQDLRTIAYSFEPDSSGNSYTLTVHKPKLQHVCRIVWEVP